MDRHPLNRIAEEAYRVPRPCGPAMSPANFMACPLALVQGLSDAQQLWQQSIYQLAFEQAQADLRRSLPARDLAGVWN